MRRNEGADHAATDTLSKAQPVCFQLPYTYFFMYKQKGYSYHWSSSDRPYQIMLYL